MPLIPLGDRGRQISFEFEAHMSTYLVPEQPGQCRDPVSKKKHTTNNPHQPNKQTTSKCSLGWQDGSWVKAAASKPEELSSILRIHMVRENCDLSVQAICYMCREGAG